MFLFGDISYSRLIDSLLEFFNPRVSFFYWAPFYYRRYLYIQKIFILAAKKTKELFNKMCSIDVKVIEDMATVWSLTIALEASQNTERQSLVT